MSDGDKKMKAPPRIPPRRIHKKLQGNASSQEAQPDKAQLTEQDLSRMLSEPGADLMAVQRQLSNLIKRRQEDEIREFREDISKRIRDAAARFEVSIGDLLGPDLANMVRHSQKEAAPVIPPKYYNPANPTETWSGRGRQPNWFKSAVENDGKQPDDMLIDSLSEGTDESL